MDDNLITLLEEYESTVYAYFHYDDLIPVPQLTLNEEEINKVIRAMKKQQGLIPKGVTWMEKGEFFAGRCPTCGKVVDSVFDRRFCNHYDCGQKLNWNIPLGEIKGEN